MTLMRPDHDHWHQRLMLFNQYSIRTHTHQSNNFEFCSGGTHISEGHLNQVIIILHERSASELHALIISYF